MQIQQLSPTDTGSKYEGLADLIHSRFDAADDRYQRAARQGKATRRDPSFRTTDNGKRKQVIR